MSVGIKTRTKFYIAEHHDDIRDVFFADLGKTRFRATVSTCGSGVLSGVTRAAEEAERCGLRAAFLLEDGQAVDAGRTVAKLEGSAKQLAVAEERIVGCMAKASGIAGAARSAVLRAQGRMDIVCGAWKKMPAAIKDAVRDGIVHGGASFRIIAVPMLYIDKNFLRMFGSIATALKAARRLSFLAPVVQLRKEAGSMAAQAAEALEGGARVLMIDTGDPADIAPCLDELHRRGRRNDCRVAFAGGVKLEAVESLAATGIDILCIGRAIVDAPLLDMRLDVEGVV